MDVITATGIPFLGIKPLRTVSRMFLDYEDTNKARPEPHDAPGRLKIAHA